MRLDKFLAQAAIGKRKDVRLYVKDGLITVNDKVELIPAIEIDEKRDIVKFKGETVKGKDKIYYMLNKPAGYITATKDEEHKTVFDLFEEDMEGVFHVGRLDKDTEGLLILTNDGEVEHKIMYPEKHINKTYFFIALGEVDKEKKRDLEKGVYINKETFLTKEAKVNKVQNFNNMNEAKSILEKKNNIVIDFENQKIVIGEITIQEGKKHQVKKMLKAVRCKVVYLERVAIGNLKLDESLKRGEYRELQGEELKQIFREENVEEIVM